MDIRRALATTMHGCGINPLIWIFSGWVRPDVAPECKVQQIPAGERETARKISAISTKEINPN